jgi:hypothetical protein
MSGALWKRLRRYANRPHGPVSDAWPDAWPDIMPGPLAAGRRAHIQRKAGVPMGHMQDGWVPASSWTPELLRQLHRCHALMEAAGGGGRGEPSCSGGVEVRG